MWNECLHLRNTWTRSTSVLCHVRFTETCQHLVRDISHIRKCRFLCISHIFLQQTQIRPQIEQRQEMTLVHTFSKQQVTFMITRSFKNHLSIKHFKSQFTVKGINASAGLHGCKFRGGCRRHAPLDIKNAHLSSWKNMEASEDFNFDKIKDIYIKHWCGKGTNLCIKLDQNAGH